MIFVYSMRSQRNPNGSVVLELEFGRWTWVHEGGPEDVIRFAIRDKTVDRLDTETYQPTRMLRTLLETLARSGAGVTMALSYDRNSVKLTVPDPNRARRAMKLVHRGLTPKGTIAVQVPDWVVALRQ